MDLPTLGQIFIPSESFNFFSLSMDYSFLFHGNYISSLTVDDLLDSSQKARDALSGIWNYIGNSNLYKQLINLGRILIMCALIFYAYQLYRKVLDDLDYRPLIPAMILPLVLIILLGNPNVPEESPVWRMSVQFRNIIYYIDKVIMESLVRDANLIDEMKRTQVTNYIRRLATDAIMQCFEIADPEQREICLRESAQPTFNELRRIHEQRTGENPSASTEWFAQVGSQLNGTSNDGKNNSNPFVWAINSMADAFVDALGLVITVCSIVTNYIIESAFILITIIAPIAIGASLFPIPSKPVYAWLMGYLGIGIWKIANNIFAGLGSYVLNRTNDFAGFNYIIFAVLIGVFAPVIGGMVGSFSALTVGQGLLSGVERTSRTVVNYAGTAAGFLLRRKR